MLALPEEASGTIFAVIRSVLAGSRLTQSGSGSDQKAAYSWAIPSSGGGPVWPVWPRESWVHALLAHGSLALEPSGRSGTRGIRVGFLYLTLRPMVIVTLPSVSACPPVAAAAAVAWAWTCDVTVQQPRQSTSALRTPPWMMPWYPWCRPGSARHSETTSGVSSAMAVSGLRIRYACMLRPFGLAGPQPKQTESQ